MKARLKKTLIIYIIVALAGISYAVWFNVTNIGIPCVFRLITHLKCPGCGFTHFFTELLKRHWYAAIKSNYLAPFFTVYILCLLIMTSVRYVRTGQRDIELGPKWLNWVFLSVVIAWGIIRNIINI